MYRKHVIPSRDPGYMYQNEEGGGSDIPLNFCLGYLNESPSQCFYPEYYPCGGGDQITQLTKNHARWNLTMHGLLLLDNHCESVNYISF